MTHTQRILRAAVLAVGLYGATLAFAADAGLLDVLRTNGLLTEAQYHALRGPRSGVQATAGSGHADLLETLLVNGYLSRAQYAELRDDAGSVPAPGPATTVSLDRGIRRSSADKAFTAHIGAYVQADSALHDDDRTDFSNGTELRRGRLSVSGTLFSGWDYRLEADFAGTTTGGSTNSVTVTDAYVRYTGLDPVTLTAGNFKVPFSLEAVGSAKYMTFMERGLPVAFLSTRRLGGMVAAKGDNWTLSAGWFGDGVTVQNADDEGMALAGRATFAPILDIGRVVHLGLSGGRVDPQQASGNGLETVRFRAKPEGNLIADGLAESASLTDVAGNSFGLSSGRLVDTGNITGDVDSYTLFGGEIAVVFGPASFQSEYIRADVNRATADDAAFDGYYVYGSWFLTGESRAYAADKGVFDMLVPKRPFNLRYGAPGAWEVAVRYSNLDLSDEDVRGGDIDNVTVGLNWYVNRFVRLSADYVNVLEVAGGAHDGDEPDIYAMRMQIAH